MGAPARYSTVTYGRCVACAPERFWLARLPLTRYEQWFISLRGSNTVPHFVFRCSAAVLFVHLFIFVFLCREGFLLHFFFVFFSGC